MLYVTVDRFERVGTVGTNYFVKSRDQIDLEIQGNLQFYSGSASPLTMTVGTELGGMKPSCGDGKVSGDDLSFLRTQIKSQLTSVHTAVMSDAGVKSYNKLTCVRDDGDAVSAPNVLSTDR